jgi:hypothetical protein
MNRKYILLLFIFLSILFFTYLYDDTQYKNENIENFTPYHKINYHKMKRKLRIHKKNMIDPFLSEIKRKFRHITT